MLAERDQLVAQRSALQNEREEYLEICNELTSQYNTLVSLSESWLDLWYEYQGLLLSITFAEDRIHELQERLDELDRERAEKVAELEAKWEKADADFHDDDGYENPYLKYPGGMQQVEEDIQRELDDFDRTQAAERMSIDAQMQSVDNDIAWMNEDISWYESTLGNYSAYQTEIESVEAQRSWVNGEINSRNQEISYLDRRIRNLDAAINALQGHP